MQTAWDRIRWLSSHRSSANLGVGLAEELMPHLDEITKTTPTLKIARMGLAEELTPYLDGITKTTPAQWALFTDS